MEKYQSYKIVSEPWIGDIPSHWIKSRVGRHFKIERGRVISKEEIQDNIGDYPVYSSQTSNNGELGKISTYDFDGEYVTWTTDGEKTGTCFHRTGKFNTTNVCGMLSVREYTPFSLKYLNYYLNQVTRPYVRLDINPKLMNNMMSEIPLIIPPLSEQHQIVQFLDSKTELIDKLISTKEPKITLLKEQRTSIINQVVTKGLNPNVKMKDSGVEWIGEIPEHWVMKKTKHIRSSDKFSLVDGPFGSNLKSEHYIDNGDVYIIESGFITSGEFKYVRDFKTISKEHFETIKRSECFEGCIIMSKIGEYYGMSGILPKLDKLTVVSGNCISIKISEKHNTNFIHKVLLLHWKNGTFKKEVQQTGQPFISMTMVDNISFPIPPLDEQNQIVEHLDSKTKEIDYMVQLEQKKIDLLKEYGQSLISEVVTGKIKVTE